MFHAILKRKGMRHEEINSSFNIFLPKKVRKDAKACLSVSRAIDITNMQFNG